MAKNKQTSLDRARSLAQYITMAAAVLDGLLWCLTSLMGNQSITVDLVSNVLISITMVGAMAMGLLYLAHLITRK